MEHILAKNFADSSFNLHKQMVNTFWLSGFEVINIILAAVTMDGETEDGFHITLFMLSIMHHINMLDNTGHSVLKTKCWS